jgi:hypothetical protein
MIEETGTIVDFIYTVFEGEPKSKKTFHLSLDYSHLGGNDDFDEFVFKQLVNVFIAGCKIKFGDVVLLEEMKGERLEMMKQYFISFGYKLFVDIESENCAARGTDSTKLGLKDHFLKINRNGYNYYIYFDNLDDV